MTIDNRAAGAVLHSFYYGLTLTFEVASLAVLLSANETRPGIIRSDASDCLYEQLASFLTVRVQLNLCPGLALEAPRQLRL